MDAHAEASEAARSLALRRWSPERRLDDAVNVIVERSADLDTDQRAAIEAALQNGEAQ